MPNIRCVSEPAECRRLWEEHIPREFISDLWEVRDCFHRYFQHQPHFLVAEDRKGVRGLLPLSLNEETESYNYFPGETWAGKTWLEQNRIIAESPRILRDMLARLSRPYYLRYLRSDSAMAGSLDQIDEIGYLFLPPKYDYSFEKYFGEFSHKTAKRIQKELGGWDGRDVAWEFDNADDFDVMIRMNLERYGESSYFHDPRFLESFRSLRQFLKDRGWLRMVKITVAGEPAAVDIGSVYNGTLTLLAGGTNANFPGIAKLINTHHMAWACEQRLQRVDFLCGDFNWKTLFHLTPAPLCLLKGDGQPVTRRAVRVARNIPAPTPVLEVQGISNA